MILIKALDYIQKELSVIPVSDKRPSLPSWRQFQTQLMTQNQVKHYFHKATGIAIICGFKGLETLDFDDAKAYTQFARTIQAEHFSLFKTLSIARTPRPGYHIRYLCPEKEISGNQVLARNCNGKPQIESRGTGGYAVAPPTDGFHNLQAQHRQILWYNDKKQFTHVFLLAREWLVSVGCRLMILDDQKPEGKREREKRKDAASKLNELNELRKKLSNLQREKSDKEEEYRDRLDQLERDFFKGNRYDENFLTALFKAYNLVQETRNDLAHFGQNSSPLPYDRLEKNAGKALEQLKIVAEGLPTISAVSQSDNEGI